MKRLIVPMGLLFGLFAILGVVRADDHSPVSLTARPAKTTLRPGETVTVVLSNFCDSAGNPADKMERIVVVANAGEILGGASAEMPMTPTGNQQAFQVGEGTVEFDYRAPLHCQKDEVKITFLNSLAYGEIDKIPMNLTEPYQTIATLTLKLNCAHYLLLEYNEDYLRLYGKERKDHRIRAILRIDLEPWVADNMLRVTNLSLLEFQGSANRVSATDQEHMQADTASPDFYNQLLLLFLDPESDDVQGLIYEDVPLLIDWHGDEIPEGPPDRINVGPVSEHRPDKREARKAGQDLAGDFPTDNETARRLRRMQRSLTQQFSATQVHPDNRVKTTQGETFFAGEGSWEKKFSNGHHRKTYRWELLLD
ncbi:MAG TPA: hypothetical protein ENN40_02895 [Candidatus Aminicenantes bacterium]|nr:hypothetical protein [Candidatus Aminicenantes bacterium]